MTQAELYVVATPLGNRLDITLRAIECLKQVRCIFAEDTREALKLMDLCGISAEGKKIHSYASHNLKKATELALKILGEGESVALVTDRGTPGISDPGALLVAAAREQGTKILPVPGASAVSALISVSGLKESEFFFVGFLPRENKPRAALFDRIARLGAAACFYESPRRIRETIEHLKAAFPQGSVFFGREMTKVFEQYELRVLADCGPENFPEQGEYVVLLRPGAVEKVQDWEEQVRLRAASDRDWSKALAAQYGIASKEAYNALQRLRAAATEES